MAKLAHVMNPFRYGILSFQYISHRVLRWSLAPLFLPIIFLSNLWLALDGSWFFVAFLAGQVGFYTLAALGYAWKDREISVKGFFVPYYFSVMNLAVYAGFLRYTKGRQSVVWEKAKRASMSPQPAK